MCICHSFIWFAQYTCILPTIYFQQNIISNIPAGRMGTPEEVSNKS